MTITALVRWVELRLREGMPSALIAGRRKMKVSEVEPWLERAGHIRRDGDDKAM